MRILSLDDIVLHILSLDDIVLQYAFYVIRYLAEIRTTSGSDNGLNEFWKETAKGNRKRQDINEDVLMVENTV